MSSVSRYLCIAVLLSFSVFQSFSQVVPAPSAPNADPTYQQLRNIGLSGEAVTVSNFTLKKDAATFILHSGTVCFVSAVQGKVTGAVFLGDGNMTLTPPIASEKRPLRLLTKEDLFNETFSQLVLRFTDSTYEDLKKAGAVSSGNCDPGPLHDTQNTLHKRLRYNLNARILQDVLGTESGGLFVAFIKGKHYSDKMVLAIDPHGAPVLADATFGEDSDILPLAPEEVELMTYEENKYGYWASFHLSDEYKSGAATGSQFNSVFHIQNQHLDTTIEKNAHLNAKAISTIVSRVNGLRVLPFDLYRTLRVQSVTGSNGESLPFIQEDKAEDYQFWVILPKGLSAGESYTLTTVYGGKDAISNQGSGNYFPIARDDWYPNSPSFSQGEYTAYDLSFRIPKGMKIAATGVLVSEDNAGGQNYTEWKSEGPQTVAGFNFGRFKMQEVKLTKPEYLVQSYANEEPPDNVKNFLSSVNNDLPSETYHGSDAAMGTMSTLPLIKKALAEGQLAVQLYTDYFGPVHFKRLAITQQTDCGFGQSWPSLVWLPMCAFYDTTVRHQLGFTDDRGYWRSVTPHEVAHQWWGHEVGSGSYRDEWIGEGFASMSSSLFLQLVEKNPKKFITFWNDERELLLERNKEGFRPIDVGPVTLGYRLRNSRSGIDIAARLIYPKGAYILHMVRMMMWSPKNGDQQFKETMQDFVKTYGGRAATTEDFKATLEKHMTPEMVTLAGGANSMDWYFDEYVYGTALPAYKLDYTFDAAADGKTVFNFKLTQSGVDDNFRMPVPIYLQLEDGHSMLLGRVRMTGNTTVSQQVPLGTLKPKGAMLNYYDDVLASPN